MQVQPPQQERKTLQQKQRKRIPRQERQVLQQQKSALDWQSPRP